MDGTREALLASAGQPAVGSVLYDKSSFGPLIGLGWSPSCCDDVARRQGEWPPSALVLS